jgi:hypothetical protein
MLVSTTCRPIAKGLAEIKNVYKNKDGKITSNRRVIPCPAEYAKALVLALARKGSITEMPYTTSNIVDDMNISVDQAHTFPPILWYNYLTSGNHPRSVEFNDKAALARALEEEQVDFWKWEPDKAARIREGFSVKRGISLVVPPDADEIEVEG